jgi:hypothetical protein
MDARQSVCEVWMTVALATGLDPRQPCVGLLCRSAGLRRFFGLAESVKL